MSYDLNKLQADIAQVQHDEAGFGTGRLVAENLVLTAAHVLWPGESGMREGNSPKFEAWKIRLTRDRASEGWSFRCGNKVIWHDFLRDLALIELLDLTGSPLRPTVGPTLKLRVAKVTRNNSHYVEVRGFPRAAKEEGQRYRDLTPAFGRLTAGYQDRPLLFGVDECDLPNDPHSGWRGMSGSMVLLRNGPDPGMIYAYGVVQEVPANFNGQLRVARLADAWEDPAFRGLLVSRGAPDKDAIDPTAAHYVIALGDHDERVNNAELEIAEKLLSFLENRRVLFSQIWGIKGIESPGTIKSVQEIRERLGTYIEAVDRGSMLSRSLRTMQKACRDFLDEWETATADSREPRQVLMSPTTDPVVERFRKTFATELLKVGKLFGFVLTSKECPGSKWKDFYEQQLFMDHSFGPPLTLGKSPF